MERAFRPADYSGANMRNVLTVAILSAGLWVPCPSPAGSDPLTKQQAARALRKAVGFFRTEVSASGGYLWRYSEDLARREGEGKASETMVWVQPPGTPTIGGAFLEAYELTGDDYYLEAARETAYALVRGQLQSGGWDYRIEFDPQQRKRYAYRVDKDQRTGRNTSTLDDDTTQSAMRFLMRVDQTLGFKDEKIHQAAEFALKSLLKAQYPNGAWPQRFSEFPDPAKYPVKKASYPETWSRTYPKKKNYSDYYTFNDNTIADTITTMFQAADTYGEDKYRAAAEKGGDFILLAQMPEPQPAWAQQYDANMHPAWARRFEPPSVTGGESQGVIRTLMLLYRLTGKKKYLEPIPAAVAYFKRSRLPDGRLARFYELKTNKPLYFTKKYELTYSSDDMPTHYAFITSWSVESLQIQYERLLKTDPAKLKPAKTGKKRTERLTPSLTKKARAVVDGMDDRGAWVEEGRLKSHGDDDPATRIIDCRTFVSNVETLSRFIAASK